MAPRAKRVKDWRAHSWRSRVLEAYEQGFTPSDILDAGSWRHCVVGEIVPASLLPPPITSKLHRLGVKFAEAVRTYEVKTAEGLLFEIEYTVERLAATGMEE